MLSIKVALLSKTKAVQLPDLAHVAGALTTQVAHDFSPIWGVDATVTALPDHTKVPAGYWPIFLVDNLPPDEGGFHWTKHKQPFAEVEANDSWSLSASHELIEMLVDPSGNRLVAGPELVVQGDQIVENPDKRVEYLVEACDPCEAPDFAYLIEDVVVSDFFTPHFHDPVVSPGTRYSFTGALTKPREVRKGGYISWSDPATDKMMQIQYFDNPQLVDLSQKSAARDSESLREYVNRAEGARSRAFSRIPNNHKLARMQMTRRGASARAAGYKAETYTRG